MAESLGFVGRSIQGRIKSGRLAVERLETARIHSHVNDMAGNSEIPAI